MTNDGFAKYHGQYRRFIAGQTLLELLQIKDNAMTLRQAELLLNDLQLRIDYLQSGSKNINEEFHKMMDGFYADGGTMG